MRYPLEDIVHRFYSWEMRGRGVLSWYRPIYPEPGFVDPAHIWQGMPAVSPSEFDDTSYSGFLSIFKEHKKKKPRQVSPVPTRPPRERATKDQELLGLRIRPHDVAMGTLESLVGTLAMGGEPLCFEIQGTRERITSSLIIPKEQASFTRSHITAHLPGILSEVWSSPKEQLLASDCPTVVVDFGLQEEFMRPIQGLSRHATDPFTPLCGLMASLGPNEMVLVQVLTERVVGPWRQSCLSSVTLSDGTPFFQNDPEMLLLAKEKAKKALFATTVRVVLQSPSAQSLRTLYMRLRSVFSIFSRPGSNSLMVLGEDGYRRDKLIHDVLHRRSHRYGMLLNSDELLSLLHPPSPTINVEALFVRSGKVLAVPQVFRGAGIVVGTNNFTGYPLQVAVPEEARMRHTHIIGATGTGKSTLLSHMITSDMEANRGLAVLDPHGDLIEECLAQIPEHRLDDVILIDPSTEGFDVGFNILEAHTATEKTALAGDIVELFERFSTSWGDQMNWILSNAVEAFLSSSQGGSLLDLRTFLVDESFRSRFLTTVTDPHIKEAWTHTFPLMRKNALVPLLTRLDTFLRSPVVRAMLSQRKGLHFPTLMQEGKIILIRLPIGLIGEANAFLLGALIVAKLHQAALGRQQLEKKERRPFYLYLDEFHYFLTPSMGPLLSGARKYGLGLIMAHQGLDQLYQGNRSIGNAVLANAAVRMCFRVSEKDAQKLIPGFAGLDVGDLLSLGIGEAFVRSGASHHVTSVKVPPPSAISHEVLESNRVALKRLGSGGFSKSTREKIQRSITPNRSTKPEPKVPDWEDEVAKFKAAEERKARITEHRKLQEFCKRFGESRGYQSTLEYRLPEGGRVDVVFVQNTHRVALEISSTTTPDHELGNIQKCLDSGFAHIIHCVVEPGKEKKMLGLVTQRLSQKDQKVVSLCQAAKLESVLERVLKSKPPPTEKRIKGYRVKVNYSQSSLSDAQEREKQLGKAIVEGLKKRKK